MDVDNKRAQPGRRACTRQQTLRVRWGVAVLWLSVGAWSACTPTFDFTDKIACRSDSDCAPGLVCFRTSDLDDGTCVTPEVLADAGSDAVVDDVGGDVAVDVAEDTAPDVAADTAPDTAPDVTPDTNDCDPDACTPGTLLCASDNVVAECVLDDLGCPTPVDQIFCSGAQTCVDGVCTDNANCQDSDNDGRGVGCALGADCDDADPSIYEGAQELCDDRDRDCDGNPSNGFNLLTDPNNCGVCGNVCQGDNATLTCAAGACQVTSCAPGFFDADGQPGNGCEYACTRFSAVEASCDDGVDDDCDGLVDAFDDECTTGRQDALSDYVGSYLIREIVNGEETLIHYAIDTRFSGNSAFLETGFVGSPLLESYGGPIDRDLRKTVADQGQGRYQLSPTPNNPTDTLSWRLYSSNDRAQTVLLGVALTGQLSVWSSAVALLTQRSNTLPSASTNGDWLGGIFRARTRSLDVRANAAQSTLRGLYTLNPVGGQTSSLQGESGPIGTPPEGYPINLALEPNAGNQLTFFRPRRTNPTVAYQGRFGMSGNLLVLRTYTPEACSADALTGPGCPPDAGIAPLVRTTLASPPLTSPAGRWVLVGVHLQRGPIDPPLPIQGRPELLGVEFTADAQGALVGVGAYDWVGALGTMTVTSGDLSLDLTNLPNAGGDEPTQLALFGRISDNGQLAVLFEGSGPNSMGDGIYVLMRL